MRKPVQVFNYSVLNSAPDTVDINIDGEIVDASTQAIIEAWFGDTTSTSYKSLRNSLEKSGAKIINVIINSPGGHVGDAMAIHDYLIEQQAQGKVVNTIGRGIVASSATLILLAGQSPEMSANSWFMMHNVSGGIFGTVDQVESYATMMRKFNDQVRNLYASKSGMRKEEVTKLMDAETWLNASEAKDKGLVVTVTGALEFSNLISSEQWDFSNTSVLNSYNSSVKQPNNIIEDMKKLFNTFSQTVMAAIKGVPVTDKTTNIELINSIAEKVGESFNSMGEQFETEVNASAKTAVTNFLKTEAGKKMITDLITAETKDLTTQVENLVGAEGKDKNTDPKNLVKPIGGFGA